jgi:hypothetical protein
MKRFELVKREDHYGLYNEDGHKIASTLDGCNSKLSIKNCEAIANGYDIKQLIKERDFKGFFSFIFNAGFREGIESILEILGDKKFSEDDMKKYRLQTKLEVLTKYSERIGLDAEGEIEETLEQLKSLQQTEWDVEVVMFTSDDLKSVEDDWVKLNKPQLDADGCLILKRIKI